MTADDLLLPTAELTQLVAALANTGVPDPVSRALAEAEALVAQYTGGYELPEAWRQRLARPLAIQQLYGLLGRVPESHRTAAETARRELEAIRDGKFRELVPADPRPSPTHPAYWGSEPDILRIEPPPAP